MSFFLHYIDPYSPNPLATMKFATRLAQLGRAAPLHERILSASKGPYPLSEDFLQRAAAASGRFMQTASKHWHDAGSITAGKVAPIAERIAQAANSSFPLSQDFLQRAAAATLDEPHHRLTAAAAFHPTAGVSPTFKSSSTLAAALTWAKGADLMIDEHGRTISTSFQSAAPSCDSRPTATIDARQSQPPAGWKFGGDSLGQAYQATRGLCAYTPGGAFCAETAKQ